MPDAASPHPPTISITLDSDRIIVAHFRPAGAAPQPLPAARPTAPPAVHEPGVRELIVRTRGRGAVHVEPDSPDGLYPPGTVITLTAEPDDGWHPENYAYVLTFPELPVWRFAVNSFIVSGGVVLLQLVICCLAAFAFARLQFPGRDAIFFVFLLTMMIPPQVLIVPLFVLVQRLGWLDTYAGLIVPYPYLSAAFGTFLLRQYFLSIPRQLDDAAHIDGCGDWGVLRHIILPASKPALATVAAFAFIWSWTDFYWPLLASSSTAMRTLEVGLSTFREAYSGEFSSWPLQMTAAVIVLVPALVFFLIMQRFFVRGVMTSGLKG